MGLLPKLGVVVPDFFTIEGIMAAVDTVLASADARRRGRFSELLAVKADLVESTSEGEHESDSRGATTPEANCSDCEGLLPSKEEGPSEEEKERHAWLQLIAAAAAAETILAGSSATL
eukprot:s534_g31.t1